MIFKFRTMQIYTILQSIMQPSEHANLCCSHFWVCGFSVSWICNIGASGSRYRKNKTHQKNLLVQKVTSAVSIELNCILEVAWWEEKTIMIFSMSNEPKLYPLTYECISIVFKLFEVLGQTSLALPAFTVHWSTVYVGCLYLVCVSFGPSSVLDLGCELCFTMCFLYFKMNYTNGGAVS